MEISILLVEDDPRTASRIEAVCRSICEEEALAFGIDPTPSIGSRKTYIDADKELDKVENGESPPLDILLLDLCLPLSSTDTSAVAANDPHYGHLLHQRASGRKLAKKIIVVTIRDTIADAVKSITYGVHAYVYKNEERGYEYSLKAALRSAWQSILIEKVSELLQTRTQWLLPHLLRATADADGRILQGLITLVDKGIGDAREALFHRLGVDLARQNAWQDSLARPILSLREAVNNAYDAWDKQYGSLLEPEEARTDVDLRTIITELQEELAPCFFGKHITRRKRETETFGEFRNNVTPAGTLISPDLLAARPQWFLKSHSQGLCSVLREIVLGGVAGMGGRIGGEMDVLIACDAESRKVEVEFIDNLCRLSPEYVEEINLLSKPCTDSVLGRAWGLYQVQLILRREGEHLEVAEEDGWTHIRYCNY